MGLFMEDIKNRIYFGKLRIVEIGRRKILRILIFLIKCVGGGAANNFTSPFFVLFIGMMFFSAKKEAVVPPLVWV